MLTGRTHPEFLCVPGSLWPLYLKIRFAGYKILRRDLISLNTPSKTLFSGVPGFPCDSYCFGGWEGWPLVLYLTLFDRPAGLGVWCLVDSSTTMTKVLSSHMVAAAWGVWVKVTISFCGVWLEKSINSCLQDFCLVRLPLSCSIC